MPQRRAQHTASIGANNPESITVISWHRWDRIILNNTMTNQRPRKRQVADRFLRKEALLIHTRKHGHAPQGIFFP